MKQAGIQLSQASFFRARSYIQAKARVIDQQRYAFHFAGAASQVVLTALAAYQNADGGFGHGIEPDFRASVSSPAGTAYGFQILRELHVPSSHPMVQKGIAYFLQSYDPTLACWPRLVPGFNDAPHEAHWHYDADLVKQEAEREWAWPAAEIVGYLYDYAELVPPPFLAHVTEQAMTHIVSLSDARLNEMMLFSVHALSVSLQEPHRQVVLAKMNRAASTALPDPTTWQQRWDVPIMFVRSPQDPLAVTLHAQVAHNLDLEIATQREDGAFAPDWTKGGSYEDEWNGYLTVRTLLALQAFGRIETTAAA